MNGRQEGLAQLVVARRHRPELLHLVEQAFHPVPLAVGLRVVRPRVDGVLLARDVRRHVGVEDAVADGVRVVAEVSPEGFGVGDLAGRVLEQPLEFRRVPRLARRERDRDRRVFVAASQVDLGRVAAAGAPERLLGLELFFFAPAAC